MRFTPRLIACALVLFCQLQFLPDASADMNTANRAQVLELRIRTEKSSFIVGEPVRLEIELRNTGGKVVRTPKYFLLPADSLDKNNLEIQVRDSAGKRLVRVSQVLTGRMLTTPELVSINPGDTYRDWIQIAGTFTLGQGRKKIGHALWSLGENPEVTSANEYPPMNEGTYSATVIYRVGERHLINLDADQRPAVWMGELISNTIELTVGASAAEGSN